MEMDEAIDLIKTKFDGVVIPMQKDEKTNPLDGENHHLTELLRVSGRVNKMLEVMIPEVAKNDMSAFEWWSLVLDQANKTMGALK